MGVMSMFESLIEAPPDSVLNIATAFKADTDPKKVDLGVGAYRDENGKPYVFPVVRKVQHKLMERNLDEEYLPIDGIPTLKLPTQRIIFGKDCKAIEEGRIVSSQVLSGTGGVRVAGEFIKAFIKDAQEVLLSDPTWVNHRGIFEACGHKIKEYRYWNTAERRINVPGMLEDLDKATNKSVVVLHACAHNPTGLDPTPQEWEQILEVVKRKQHIPIFDVAYQGFASGDLDKDAYSMRLFYKAGLELYVCESFSKNMGLYGERIGMLHIVCNSADRAKVVTSLVKQVMRQMYSNPPSWGARIVNEVLNSEEYTTEWKNQLQHVAERICKVRVLLVDGLKAKKTPGSWDHIVKQIGMFSYTGLTKAQCERMTSKWHVHMTKTGRMSMAGLNLNNVNHVVEAMDDCVRNA